MQKQDTVFTDTRQSRRGVHDMTEQQQAKLESFEQQYRARREQAESALKRAPGPCVVEYVVYGKEHKRPFNSLLQAFTWVSVRERAGEQSTIGYRLEDGTYLLASTACWHIADEISDNDERW